MDDYIVCLPDLHNSVCRFYKMLEKVCKKFRENKMSNKILSTMLLNRPASSFTK
jgi:hypothetical protein